ncbi:fungal-specific transcription factor domain-containing protein [Xylariales sp. PMI_506]|nr:fungal-specific transcription factor domain-containing protein [Xylariales sp. PMI_506]
MVESAMTVYVDGQSARRRKVCDLCFAKKIKCDLLEPQCSNCKLYHAECRTSIGRSRSKPPKPVLQTTIPKPLKQSGPTPSLAKGIESVDTRLKTLERKMQEIIDNAQNVHSQQDAVNARISAAESLLSESSRSNTPQNEGIWKFDSARPSLYYGPADGSPSLPPLDDIMPLIDHYFNLSNRVLPLFDQDSFMRLITAWYKPDAKHDRLSWAIILVVVALGLQSRFPGDAIEASTDQAKFAGLLDYCMRNAQSVIPELVARDEDLLGLRVILSLVLLFRSSGDLRPAAVLSGMAVTLCRRMHLHCSDVARHFTAEEAEQRSRVFWVLYIIDRDLSMRTKTPPALADDDIDMPSLPTASASLDDVGVIRIRDGRSELNIFRLNADLGAVQGRVYRLLYAGSSARISSTERRKRVADLQVALDDWYEQIPVELLQLGEDDGNIAASGLDGYGNDDDATAAAAAHDANRGQLAVLYHSYLLCLVSIHGIYSSQAEWMRRVGSLGRAAIRDFAVAIQGPKVTLCIEKQEPPMLGAGWDHCVKVARTSVRLFQATMPTESLVWQCSCAHFSALIILLANILLDPTSASAGPDLEAAAQSAQLFYELFDLVESAAYEAAHRVIKDLHRTAVASVAVVAAADHGQHVLEAADPLLPPDVSAFNGLHEDLDGLFSAGDMSFLRPQMGDDLFGPADLGSGGTLDALDEESWGIVI